MSKVILFKGTFKISPPFKPQQVSSIKQNHRFDEFNFTNNSLECKCILQELTEDDAFWDVNYIIETYENMNKLKGEVIGLLFNDDKYKFCRWFIKNNTISHEFIECNITKKGKPRGPSNRRPKESPAPSRSRQLQRDSSEVVSIEPKKAPSPPKKKMSMESKNIFSNEPEKKKPSPPPNKKKLSVQNFEQYSAKPEPNPPKVISLKTLESLNDKLFVDDLAIDAYIDIYNRKRKDGRKISVQTNFIMDVMQSNLFNEILGWKEFKDKGVGYYDYILFPIHWADKRSKDPDNSGHWILCIIDIQQKVINIYDSMQDGRKYNNITSKIKQFLHQGGIKGAFKVDYIKGPEQTTSYDCGVFVAEFAKRWLLKEPIDFTQNDISKIRKHMKHLLLSYLNDQAKDDLIKQLP